MTFDIEAWTSDGRGSVTVKGPLMSGQLEQGIIDITDQIKKSSSEDDVKDAVVDGFKKALKNKKGSKK